jgi:hypothetical protein
MLKFLGLVCLLSVAVVAEAARIPEMPPAPQPPRGVAGVLVNCNTGQSIQAAVDAATAPAQILIAGICTENVLIREKDISLRGIQTPALDGIRSTNPSLPALTFRGSVIATVTNLSFSLSAGAGAAVRGGGNITFTNCLFDRDNVGLRVDSGSFVIGNGLTFTANINSHANASGGQIFCIGCDVSGGGPAAVAIRGSVVSFLDSVITGSQGLVSVDRGSSADIDCATIDTPHACGINAGGFAALGVSGGTASLIAVSDFSGQLIADDRGTVRLDGSRQSSTGGPPNVADSLGEIIVAPLFVDGQQVAQSLLRGAQAAHFARVLFTGDSILNGSIQCSGAADAFLDPTVTSLPGSAVSGCEHASVP